MEAFEYVIEREDVALQYGVTEGIPTLRKELSKFMSRTMNINSRSENILITVGSQEVLELIGRIFVDRGSKVIVELPTYIAAVQAFSFWKAKFIGIPIDDEGMRTDVLEEKLKRIYSRGGFIKFVYTIPTGHNPAGVVLSLERRKHLLELAEKYGFYIVEDDPYGFITFTNNIPHRLKALDRSDRVIYMSTLSKIFGPGLRLGWVTGPEKVIKTMSLAKQSMNLCTPNLNQAIAEYFLKTGMIEDNIPKIKALYKKKRDVMLEALDEYMFKEARWTRPIAGFFIFMYLPKAINTKAVLYEAVEKIKVAYVPGSGFYVNGKGHNTLRLSYSLPPPSEIREGIKRLASFFSEKVTRKRSPIQEIT
jgi:2-aminoadipate transaminase